MNIGQIGKYVNHYLYLFLLLNISIFFSLLSILKTRIEMRRIQIQFACQSIKVHFAVYVE